MPSMVTRKAKLPAIATPSAVLAILPLRRPARREAISRPIGSRVPKPVAAIGSALPQRPFRRLASMPVAR